MGREKNKRRELDNEAKVVLKNIRVSPQKLNLVAQMIRKETASKAISILQFSKRKGNDLTTPNPFYNFKGLKQGDKWCLCVSRWVEAFEAGCAPKVLLEATNIKTLDYVNFEYLLEHKA